MVLLVPLGLSLGLAFAIMAIEISGHGDILLEIIAITTLYLTITLILTGTKFGKKLIDSGR